MRPQSGSSPKQDFSCQLNKYCALCGIASRRGAIEFIKEGRIKVNGVAKTDPGYRVQSGDVVKFGSKVIRPNKKFYILLNKPRNCVATVTDELERRTVMDVIGADPKLGLHPVGRLDQYTTGVLLITNDGELTDKLAHPRNEVEKVYQVSTTKEIDPKHIAAIKSGVKLEDGFIKADQIHFVRGRKDSVILTLHSGKNRVIRRMFESLGYLISSLDRVSFAGIGQGDVKRGGWRNLTSHEVSRLKS